MIFCDLLTGMDYIRSCIEIAQKALYVQPDACRARVFLDFRMIADDSQQSWQRVHDHLKGRGIADIQRFRWELPLRELLRPLREIFNPAYFEFLLKSLPQTAGGELPRYLLNEAGHKLVELAGDAQRLMLEAKLDESAAKALANRMRALCASLWIDQNLPLETNHSASLLLELIRGNVTGEKWLAIFGWILMTGLCDALDMDRYSLSVRNWRLLGVFEEALLGVSAVSAVNAANLLLHLEGGLRDSNWKAGWKFWIITSLHASIAAEDLITLASQLPIKKSLYSICARISSRRLFCFTSSSVALNVYSLDITACFEVVSTLALL